MSSNRKITKKMFDRLKRDIDGVIYCPHGDYTGIKTFPEYCWFPARCDFGDEISFGERCIFGFQCSFGMSCNFGARCDFASNCDFQDKCTFGMGCTFAEFGIFGSECVFGDRCDFAAVNNFLSDCHFGECCIFGESCTFGENTSHEHLTNSSYFACDRIGYFFRAKEGYFVRCDEFFGTLDQFIEHVRKSYGGTRYENEYLAAVDLAKFVLDGNEPIYKVRRSAYDEGNDVLYVHFSPFNHQAYGDDDGHENIILRKDMKTDKVIGATIFYAKSEMEQRQEELKKIGYNIDIQSLIGKAR